MLGCDEKEVEFDGDKVIYRGEKTLEKTEVSLFDIATASMAGNSIALEETVTNEPANFTTAIYGRRGRCGSGSSDRTGKSDRLLYCC